MIVLTRSDPDRNMHRFYALDVTPTLFGNWAIIVEWGRIGSPGVVQRRTFTNEATANAALAERLALGLSPGLAVHGIAESARFAVVGDRTP